MTTVTVEEVAHGGYQVVIRLSVGADRDSAARTAQQIRERGWVDLRDPRWST